MKEHPNDYRMQHKCLLVLAYFMYDENSNVENVLAQTAVAKVEGIQVILAAMKRFPRIGSGFLALNNIVFKNEANANLLVTKLGGLPFLIKRMTGFQDDWHFTENACRMLNSLSYFEHLRKPIIDAIGLSALSNAIERHKDDDVIENLARETMKRLL